MLIQELSYDECLKVLAGSRTARLACVHEDQPYIVPVYLTYDAATSGVPSLYGVTTRGAKIEWMRTNPRVCVEVDEITDFDQWVSVVALGRFEELKPEGEDDRLPHLRHPRPSEVQVPTQTSPTTERLRAFQLLQHQPMWWEPASSAWSSRANRKPGESYEPVYYRISIDQISGHRAIPQAPAV